MPRNGSGTYTTPNSFSAGATIASAQVNANFTDVGAEITGSLPTNGEKGMSGQLKSASGTVALPGVAFTSDTDCGFYRIGADNIGMAIGGVKVLDISATGLGVTGGVSGMGATPIGGLMDYAGSSAPTGWLLCYGQAVSRTTYASLFAIISTTYGVGDASTTFNVPDARGRVIAGQDDMGGTSADRLTGLPNGVDGDTLGGTGGKESTTLTAGDMPQQTTTSNGAHTHLAGGDLAIANGGFGTARSNAATGNATSSDGAHTHTVGNASPTAINNVQPTLVLNKIIYAGS